MSTITLGTVIENTDVTEKVINTLKFNKWALVQHGEGQLIVVEDPTVQSLEEMKKNKLLLLNSEFDKLMQTAHLTSSLGFEIDANETANRNVNGLVVLMNQEGAPETITFCDYNNEFHTLNKTELMTILTEIINNGSMMYAKKWELRSKIENATSEDEVESIIVQF